MVQKFPTLRSDGSFSIIASFSVSDDAGNYIVGELTEWIDCWIKREDPWVREWSSGKVDNLNFYDEFSSPPKMIGVKDGKALIRFDGCSNGKWWKDWVAKFAKQIVDESPNVICFLRCEDVKNSENGE